ncbi:MAG: cytochrome c3 family protein [bacterium]
MGYKRFFLFFLFSAGVLFQANDLFSDNLSCLVCHGALKGTYMTRQGVRTSLHVDGEKYASSVHADLDCTTCHLKYQDNPHKSTDQGLDETILGLAQAIQKKSPVDPVAQAACIQCHNEIYLEVKNSVHGINIFQKNETDAALCLDCHGSPHEIVAAAGTNTERGPLKSAVAYEQIVTTCGRCHEQKSVSLKYGFSTRIIQRYNESFHGKKYHLGGKNLPVCTTCHGSHSIRSHKDPQSLVYGTNKITLCKQCHAGANAEFVAAITHKPIGKDNPIPYYAEKGLIILTMGVIAGCALHILLQIYAAIRDAIQYSRRMSR